MSKAADSDIKMMIAAQVAYLDGDEGMTVKELVDRTIADYSERGELSEKEKSQLDKAVTIRDQIEEYDLNECNRWVIQEVHDTNDETGFYGCLIDTRDGGAVVAFRGSECYDATQLKNDWILSDFGLLNNPETTQQKQAEEFTKYINDKYGDRYDSYSFAGHSLGGNLAEHATITAPEDMNIGRGVSFDGPGFSEEYIARHKWQIQERAKLVDHYQYTAVGNCLYPLMGSKYRTIATKSAPGSEGFDIYTSRHNLENVVFDESGMVQDGTMDPLAKVVGAVSRDVENGAPALMWLLSPTLAVLWTIADRGYTLLLGVISDVEKLAETVSKTLADIKESVVNWFRNMFGVALTGKYEMNISSVNAMRGELEDISGELGRISTEVSEIASTLRYNSMSGYYFKSKLRTISHKVRTSSKKSYALSAAAGDCAKYTSSDDAKGAQYFAAV